MRFLELNLRKQSQGDRFTARLSRLSQPRPQELDSLLGFLKLAV